MFTLKVTGISVYMNDMTTDRPTTAGDHMRHESVDGDDACVSRCIKLYDDYLI